MKDKIDATIISNVLMADGIGRQGVGFLSTVKDHLKVNFLNLNEANYKDVPSDVLPYLITPFSGYGKVSLWTFILGLNEKYIPLHEQSDSKIKIAYSMFESDLIPKLWVKILNEYYDAVVVPDPYLVSVYKNSGVKIPLFVIPLGIYLEKFLEQEPKKQRNQVFTFGLSAGFWERKNHIKLIQAFKKKFSNDPNFLLRIHGRFGSYAQKVEKFVKDSGIKNLEFISLPYSNKEYLEFMKSLDCYVFPSMGEGFSVTPREALALGIPCVLTNNTVHHTLMDAGCFVKVCSNIKTPAKYEVFQNQTIGNFYDCDVDDLAEKMKYVVDNYDHCLEQVKNGRDWVKQFLWKNLSPHYTTLLKPKKLTLNVKESNMVCNDGTLVTNSEKLYKKYQEIL